MSKNTTLKAGPDYVDVMVIHTLNAVTLIQGTARVVLPLQVLQELSDELYSTGSVTK